MLFYSSDHYRTGRKELVWLHKILFNLSCEYDWRPYFLIVIAFIMLQTKTYIAVKYINTSILK